MTITLNGERASFSTHNKTELALQSRQPETEKRLQTVADFLAMLPAAENTVSTEKDKPEKKKGRTVARVLVPVLVVILGLLAALLING